MNHIYRSIWSESLATWVAVPENTASKGKRCSVKKVVIATGLLAFSSAGFALPTGGQVVAGQVNISTPSTTQMNIQQGSQNAVVNWNGFSIAAPETVNIQQPNVSAVLLNRVVGVDASVIQGHLNANGQVFLINPNGVLFSNTAQVDVGGLVASTHNISNADFMNGNYHFTQNGATGSVSNQGFIKTPFGGTVALIGEQVSNSGTIQTPQGTTALAAGATVDLDFKGAGLVEVKIPQAALNAQIANSGAIMADAGRVVLTAKAAGQLSATVINQTGLIQAHSLASRNGEILLDGGDNGTVHAGGTLDVSGQNANGGTIKVFGGMQSGAVNVVGKLDASASGTATNGGFIETSAAHVKIADSAKITTKAANGLNGTWLIDPQDFTISATGDMTPTALSAALGSTNTTILNSTGAIPGNGDIFVNDAVSWSANTLTLNAQNNININAGLNATGTGSLTLIAGNTINAPAAVSINGIFTLSSGTWSQVLSSLPSFFANDFRINNATATFIRSLGGNGTSSSPYQLTDVYGLQGMGSAGMLSKAYRLANNIDASGTSNWNGIEGFFPVGIYPILAPVSFSGSFDGQGHTISGLHINHSSSTFAGLGVGVFGAISPGGIINNVGLVNADITGKDNTGALVGYNYDGTISNSYVTGTSTVTGTGNNVGGLVGFNLSGSSINNSYVTAASIVSGAYGIGGLVGSNYGSVSNSSAAGHVYGKVVGGLVGNSYGSIINSHTTGLVSASSGDAPIAGGLVGNNSGTIQNSYSTAKVGSGDYAGGLVGYNSGSVSNGYATGMVNGSKNVGGLVGNNYGSISNTYATGTVNGSSYVGGLVGANNSGSISNSHATGDVTGSYRVGGLVGDNLGSVSQSYATGNVIGTTGATAIGGLAGDNDLGAIISESYATGSVSGTSQIGGLVGANYGQGTISNAYATGSVSGSYGVGGLAGHNFGVISNVYATGSVSGNDDVGGLVGKNFSSISNTYASGLVTGSGSWIGGLVGCNQSGTISNSFWDINTAGQPLGVGFNDTGGVTGLPTTQMMQKAIFESAGWSIANTGGSSAIWRIYEGNTRPLLRSFLTPLTIYSDGSYSLASVDRAHLFNSATGIYSDQLGYDITNASSPDLNLGPVVTPVFPPASEDAGTNSKSVTQDSTEDFANADNSSPGLPCKSGSSDCDKRVVFEPKLKIKDTAGRVERLQMSADKQYVTLLMEDGSVRVWDFLRGLQRQIVTDQKKQAAITDIGSVDKEGTFVSIANKNGITVREIISALVDESLGIRLQDINHYVTSDDGSLSLVSTSTGEVILIRWKAEQPSQHSMKQAVNSQPDSQQYASRQEDTEESEEVSSDDAAVNNSGRADNQPQQKRSGNLELAANIPAIDKKSGKLWQMTYPRGAVKSLAISNDKRYGAVLSREPGVYGLSASDLKSKPLTDAVNVIDLATGKVIKTLPNQGENVVFMEFKDNDILQIALASGEVYNWSIAAGRQQTVADFAENVVEVDTDAARETFAFILKDGTVRVGNDQNNVRLSIQNKDNPFKYAKLLANGKRLLTVLASGDLALWDVASGKKLLRLFSMKDGWTVMDAYGRFDGSEGAIENFSWLANENNIPLDKFSENYYEPGLLSNVLQNQDFINENPSMVQGGITLPPRLNLQLAAQQNQGDSVALQLDVYDRGGGIDQIRIYQDGKLLSNDNVIVTQTKEADHRLLKLNILPNAGKNTIKVVATNDMGLESSGAELSFDGKSKAYSPSLKLMTVGINKYSDPNLTLSYSVADANAIAQSIKNHSKVAASKSLTDARATKTRILAELKELSRGAQHDQLVIYLAGHGIASGKEWYFLPHETRIQPTIEKIVETGITATELGEIFKQSKIQHILLMVDACYSGASTDAFSKLENGQRYFTRQLSRSLGITVVTATTKDQEAAELQSLGHGLFTYLMIQEMDKKNAKKPVTAHSIAASIVKDLPAFSKKMLGVSQDPAVHTFGSDFMLIDSAAKSGQK